MLDGANDKKNKRIAFLFSAGLHGLLFALLFLLVSWGPPDPPYSGTGEVIALGFDEQGGGEDTPQNVPVGQQVPDDNQGDPKTVPSEMKPAEPKEEKQEAKTDSKSDIVSDEESQVVVKEKPKKKEEKPKEEKVTPATTTTTPSVKAPEKKPEINKEAVYNGNKGAKKGDGGQNQGDDPGKAGNKGRPDGELNGKAIYGNSGTGGPGLGGNGFGLSMVGWEWSDKPRIPDLPDNEDGRIVFEIECDENGDITRITTTDRGLSAKAEQLLKEEIRRNSLRRTADGQAPAKSKGKVVFVLKTK